MKKILFAIAIVMTMSFAASAQDGVDGFFSNTQDENNRAEGDAFNGIAFPGSHKVTGNPDAAPLGSGLLILTALGSGFVLLRKKDA